MAQLKISILIRGVTLLLNKYMKHNTKGQTLIEVSIALSAILLTLAAISILVVTSVSNSIFIKNQSQAAKYAQEGMEYVRYLKNNNIPLFTSYDGTLCMGDNNTLAVSTGGCTQINVDGQYIRQVDFNKGGSINCVDQTEVTVTVRWQSTKCTGTDTAGRFCHTSVLLSCFQDPSVQSVGL